MQDNRRSNGFTLVELLVVIGIIALLISILLPSLNRARQQANLLVCESNLKTIGEMIQEYAAEHQGYTPPCWSQTYYTSFADTLTLMVNHTYATTDFAGQTGTAALAYEFEPPQDLKVFQDTDCVSSQWYAHSCAYMCNIRAFGATDKPNEIYDPVNGAGAKGYSVRKLATIRRASDVMMIWCGACNINSGINYGVKWTFPDALDGYQMSNGHGLCYPTPAKSTFSPQSYANLIALGATNPLGGAAPNSQTGGVTLSYLKLENMDFMNNGSGTNFSGFGGFDVCNMRFRHMNNTACNFLFVDGHVASRSIGTVIAQDICMNPASPP
jgi:prepilin-type N-terminal cleavage/methylation domain-containing protein/prepilin-type processing-associated H-X9-DG protein